ncbi:MAG: hypothetical protein KF781_07290 [Chitinophagaceae bacterium]|nr:hypothetical protein [Chitinophagaceae bacterium]MCW5903972.1 hypothetical protein [Chitinophagaceae bacterium]
MKKIMLVMLGTSLLFSVSKINAQETQRTKRMQGFQQGRMERMKNGNEFGKNLNLTDEQKAKAREINKDYQSKINALKSNDKLTMGEFKKQEATLKKERNDKLFAILTPEQKEKAEKFKNNVQEGKGQKAEQMKKELNLTDEQAAKIKDINATYATKIKAIRDNSSLSKEEKKQQLSALMKERKNAVDKVLTQEQIKKRDELLKERKSKRMSKEK